jgi:hypothetical protein
MYQGGANYLLVGRVVVVVAAAALWVAAVEAVVV